MINITLPMKCPFCGGDFIKRNTHSDYTYDYRCANSPHKNFIFLTIEDDSYFAVSVMFNSFVLELTIADYVGDFARRSTTLYYTKYNKYICKLNYLIDIDFSSLKDIENKINILKIFS